jgi:DNA repair exonuclease SbcCD nuclease subunit
MKVLSVGDIHIQESNLKEIDLLLLKLEEICKEKAPDFIVLLGDTLHFHNRLHTPELNKAYEFVNRLRVFSPVFLLIGNHCYINNSQFLTDNHWANGLKEWEHVTVVDRVISFKNFYFVPYVPNGQFREALNTVDSGWESASCIFAHQEFKGCKMGAITSIEGDDWPEDYPLVISGHIHKSQQPQKNIMYTGSSIQVAFGESTKNSVLFSIFKNKIVHECIDLDLPRKRIVYIDIENINDFKPSDTKNDTVKLTIKGNYLQFKALKKTKKYKDIVASGVKVVYKPTSIIKSKEPVVEETSVKTILEGLLRQHKDEVIKGHLLKFFEEIF